MSIAIRGLRVKPSYEQLINVAVSDGLEQINFLIVTHHSYEMGIYSAN